MNAGCAGFSSAELFEYPSCQVTKALTLRVHPVVIGRVTNVYVGEQLTLVKLCGAPKLFDIIRAGKALKLDNVDIRSFEIKHDAIVVRNKQSRIKPVQVLAQSNECLT